MIKELKDLVLPLLKSLNQTPIKRILIYFMLLYPLTVTYIYRAEIKLLLFPKENMVTVSDIAEAQQRCFELRSKYLAETVSLYVYQPAGKNKTHKERMVFSTGTNYVPIASLKNINLYSRSRILEDLRKQHYARITKFSKHEESTVLVAYDLDEAIITPIINQQNGEVIGEVTFIFKRHQKIDYSDLVADSQYFGLLIHDNF